MTARVLLIDHPLGKRDDRASARLAAKGLSKAVKPAPRFNAAAAAAQDALDAEARAGLGTAPASADDGVLERKCRRRLQKKLAREPTEAEVAAAVAKRKRRHGGEAVTAPLSGDASKKRARDPVEPSEAETEKKAKKAAKKAKKAAKKAKKASGR